MVAREMMTMEMMKQMPALNGMADMKMAMAKPTDGMAMTTDKVMAAKKSLMQDPAAMASMMKDAMIRQMAAQQMATMSEPSMSKN